MKIRRTLFMNKSLSLVALMTLALVCIAAPTSHGNPNSPGMSLDDNCAKLADDLADLKSEKAGLQEDLKTASTNEKKVLIAQIDVLSTKITAKTKQLENCPCPNSGGYPYAFPFGDDPKWKLTNGNWDDPVNGHNKGNPNGGQAFSFDFTYGTGTEGHNILAARDGIVFYLASDRTLNIWGKIEGDPGYVPAGEGNYVVIRHSDGTAATYGHLQKGKIFVTWLQPVVKGQVIGLSGNTGNSGGPHVHFDVHTEWHSPCNYGPTLKIQFRDKNFKCWRPKVGDKLVPDNN